MSPTTAVGATSLTTAGCSAIVCGPVVAVAVVIVIASIIMVCNVHYSDDDHHTVR